MGNMQDAHTTTKCGRDVSRHWPHSIGAGRNDPESPPDAHLARFQYRLVASSYAMVSE